MGNNKKVYKVNEHEYIPKLGNNLRQTMTRANMPAALIKDALLSGEWKRKIEWEHWSSLFHCVVIPMNDIALSLLKDAHVALKKTKRYKHSVKKNIKAAERAGDKYERMLYEESRLNRYGDRRGYLMDYMDTWQENMKHDIDILRFSINRYVNRLNIKEAELATSVFLTHVMLEYACVLWDSFWKMAKEKTGKDLSTMYKAARLTNVLNYFVTVSQSFDPQNIVNINDDKDCQLAMNIIERKATSVNTINAAGEQALEYHKDLIKWSDELEEKREKEKERFLNQ